MRLIDAKKENERLLDFIAQKDSEIKYAIEHKDRTLLEEIFFEFFNEQPTAYDLDKVVKQLERDVEIALDGYAICGVNTPIAIHTKWLTRYKERLNCLKVVKSGIHQKEGATDDEQTQADLI